MVLSVITPVWNRQDCILNCLKSVASQKHANFEVEHVVVDDGSTDNTAELVATYAQTHPHVKAIYFGTNRGTNAARNAAISAATGDYVIFLDSDDIMLDDALAVVAETISANPEYDYFMFGCDDVNYHFCEPDAAKELTFGDFIQGKYNVDYVHVVPRKIISSVPFDEELRIHEGIFFLRFYKIAGHILFVNKILFHRDRTRDDHVSFTLHKTDDSVLQKECKSQELMYQWFAHDMMQTGAGRRRLCHFLTRSYINHVLLGDYSSAEEDARRLAAVSEQAQPPFVFRMTAAIHGGRIAWTVIKNLVKAKHWYRRFSKTSRNL